MSVGDGSGGRVTRGFVVSGRVQGVGFRWWTTRTASEAGLSGSVRNRRDGSVEIHVAGRFEDLERFEERLRNGPPGARVDDVTPVASDLPIPEGDFRIVR